VFEAVKTFVKINPESKCTRGTFGLEVAAVGANGGEKLWKQQ
jgi:hypothetical protein